MKFWRVASPGPNFAKAEHCLGPDKSDRSGGDSPAETKRLPVRSGRRTLFGTAMKFTLSWLKDHIETDATLDEIVAALTKSALRSNMP